MGGFDTVTQNESALARFTFGVHLGTLRAL